MTTFWAKLAVFSHITPACPCNLASKKNQTWKLIKYWIVHMRLNWSYTVHVVTHSDITSALILLGHVYGVCGAQLAHIPTSGRHSPTDLLLDCFGLCLRFCLGSLAFLQRLHNFIKLVNCCRYLLQSLRQSVNLTWQKNLDASCKFKKLWRVAPHPCPTSLAILPGHQQ